MPDIAWYVILMFHVRWRIKTTRIQMIGLRKKCVLTLPHSWAGDDNIKLQTVGEACTDFEAFEDGCRLAVFHLLRVKPFQVRQCDDHWRISTAELVAMMPHRKFPPWEPWAEAHLSPRQDAGMVVKAPQLTDFSGGPGPWADRVAELLHCCLYRSGGEFDPSNASLSGCDIDAQRAYATLNNLLTPNGLKPFIEAHEDVFAWRPHSRIGGRHFVVRWASDEAMWNTVNRLTRRFWDRRRPIASGGAANGATASTTAAASPIGGTQPVVSTGRHAIWRDMRDRSLD